jgi:hypothetical protein
MPTTNILIVTIDTEPSADGEAALLAKYSPVLVLLPEDPAKRRPGKYWQGDEGRGDYHPCSVELFLSNATLFNPRRRHRGDTSGERGRGIDALLDEIVRTGGDTLDWEINLDGFGRGDAQNAWHRYHAALAEQRRHKSNYRPTAYARLVRRDGYIALQYWYLYFYNDAANKHEGDWEMVTVLLKEMGDDAEPVPAMVGYSGHESGARRAWQGISRKGERPLVYVARGSHAAYLQHLAHGYHTGKLSYRKGLKPWQESVYKAVFGLPSRWFFFLGVRDYTASLEDEHDGNKGEIVEHIDLRVMPEKRPPLDSIRTSPAWWRFLDCPWGSSRPAPGPFGGQFLGPDPPWLQEPKWTNPVNWVLSLRER